MKVNCDYCGSYIETTDEECPHCGAKNSHFARTASDTPKTIEELRSYCESKNLPLERMHVHLGENYNAPKAFGIYKDDKTGHFVVYKNKADGQRAIRYEGTDEAYAVNELYLKIKDLVMDAREATVSSGKTTAKKSSGLFKKVVRILCIYFIVQFIITMIVLGVTIFGKSKKNGYYEHNGTSYYKHGSYWYEYDDRDDSWERVYGVSSDIDADDYLGEDYRRSFDAGEFPIDDFSGDWYSSNDWDSDDWDSNDYDWNDSYDDYDFGGGDWDSDWYIRPIFLQKYVFNGVIVYPTLVADYYY